MLYFQRLGVTFVFQEKPGMIRKAFFRRVIFPEIVFYPVAEHLYTVSHYRRNAYYLRKLQVGPAAVFGGGKQLLIAVYAIGILHAKEHIAGGGFAPAAFQRCLGEYGYGGYAGFCLGFFSIGQVFIYKFMLLHN